MFGRSAGTASGVGSSRTGGILARQGRRAVASDTATGTNRRTGASATGARGAMSGAGGRIGAGTATKSRVGHGYGSPAATGRATATGKSPVGSSSSFRISRRTPGSSSAAKDSSVAVRARRLRAAASSGTGASSAASARVSSTASASSGSASGAGSSKAARLRFDLRDLELKTTVGTGTFGRVRVVRHIPSGKHFALKMLSKAGILAMRQFEHVKSEVSILHSVSHPFIVNLLGHSQDAKRLYLLMEYVPGGELFTKLRAEDSFSATTSRFYAAEIALAFEYLHSHGIVYRDLKPENLLFSAAGHIKITDFGFAKRVGVDKTYTVCGTPEYLSPEAIQTRGHGIPVDWWALGVLIYEMLAGLPPFFDETPYGIYQKILKGRLRFPRGFDVKASDLVAKLLTMDPTRRLGCQRAGAADVRAHRWFAKLDWNALESCSVEPPYVPSIRSDGDTRHFPEDYPDSDDDAKAISSSDQSAFVVFDSF